MVLVPAILVALTVFFRYSSLGKQIRAAANNPDAAAHTIIAVYLGLMVLAKDAPEAAGVRATLDQTMKLLS